MFETQSLTPGLVRWHRFADLKELQQAAVERILCAEDRALRSGGTFSIVLAGGETPRGAYARLRYAKADWRSWHVYFGDERCAPVDDATRNSKMAQVAWLGHVAIPQSQVHAIPAELGAEAGAERYAALLASAPIFDFVLLGLGEDGHTASLFPGDARGLRADAPDALPVFEAPKPPPQRVTMSARRLSRAHEVLYLVEGPAKREAVRRWRRGDQIPAASIRPQGGVDVMLGSSLL